MDPLPQLIEPSRTALIVIDVQNDYCHPDGTLGKAGSDLSSVDGVVANIQSLIDTARSIGVPVIFVRNWHETWTNSDAWLNRKKSKSQAAHARSWGAEFYQVEPLPDEPVINKQRYSAFIGTPIDQMLHTLKRDTLIMTGVATNVCVESTARHAVFLDYRIVFGSDTTATGDGEAIQKATLANMERHFGAVASAAEILDAWANVPNHA